MIPIIQILILGCFSDLKVLRDPGKIVESKYAGLDQILSWCDSVYFRQLQQRCADLTLCCQFLRPVSPAASLLCQGMGEAGFFLGSSVFFAIRDAVAAARKERGLPLDFTLNSPLTVERIRMACDDVFTEMVRVFSFLK